MERRQQKEAVESRAIELRHKLTQHLGQRAQHPTTAVEHVRYEAPPPAKDPNAEKLAYPEETLTLARDSNTTEKLMSRLDWGQKLRASQRRASRWLWMWKKRVRKRNRSQWR